MLNPPNRLRMTLGTQRRSFEAALTTRLTEDLPRSPVAPNQLVREAHTTMLARARHLHANHEQVRGWIEHRLPSQVLGASGIQIQPQIRRARGTQLRTRLNEQLESAWKEWSRVGSCTMDGQLSFKGVLAMILKSIARDGEVLIQFVRGRDTPNRFGFALHIMEGEHLDILYDQRYAGPTGQPILMGVELNRWRRPVAYHVLEDNPHDHIFAFGQRFRARMLPRDLLHLYVPFYPSQVRGISWLHAAANGGAHLQRYREAELVAAREAASKATALESQDDSPASLIAGMETQADENGQPKFVLQNTVEPGQLFAAPPGWAVKTIDPTHPNGNFAGFEKAILRGMASSLGASYHGFSGDLESVNYSSARMGAVEEREIWRDLQTWTVEHVVEPIFRAWLEVAALEALPMINPNQIEDIQAQVAWQRRGFGWIDPQKEVLGTEKELALGITTRTDVLSKQGKDYREVVAQLAEEQRLRDEAGLVQDAGDASNGNAEEEDDPVSSDEPDGDDDGSDDTDGGDASPGDSDGADDRRGRQRGRARRSRRSD